MNLLPNFIPSQIKVCLNWVYDVNCVTQSTEFTVKKRLQRGDEDAEKTKSKKSAYKNDLIQ